MTTNDTVKVMTLEQARDACQKAALDSLSNLNRHWYQSIVDAIDTHLATRVKVTDEQVMLFRRFLDEKEGVMIEWHTAVAALESFAASLPVAKVREDSCDDVDVILSKLGLTVEQARTECGNLRVQRICNHIQETLDALSQAHSFGVEMCDKYVLLAQGHGGARDGWKWVPVEPTEAMVDIGSDVEVKDSHYGYNAMGIKAASSVWKAMLDAAPGADGEGNGNG